MWKLVNIKSSKNKNINILHNNNDLLNNSLKIANKDYFSTIGSAVEKKISNINGRYKDYFSIIDKHGKLIINCNNSLYLTPTTPD